MTVWKKKYLQPSHSFTLWLLVHRRLPTRAQPDDIKDRSCTFKGWQRRSRSTCSFSAHKSMTSGGESDGGYICYKKWLHIGGCFVPFYNTYKALAGWCRFNTPCHFFHDSPCLIGKESKYIWGCRFWCWIGIQKSKDTYIPYLGYLLNMTLRQTWIVIVLLAYLYIFIFPKKKKIQNKKGMAFIYSCHIE